MKIRNIIVILICVILLSSCGKASKKESEIFLVSKSPISEYDSNSEKKSVFSTNRHLNREVTDLKGKHRQLSLLKSEIFEKSRVGMDINFYATQYSQVEDDEYYYARKTGETQYSIYKNRGDLVGKFNLPTGQFLEGYAKYGDDFYVNINVENSNQDGYKQYLAKVDLVKGKVFVIYEYPRWIVEDRAYFFNNNIYINSYASNFIAELNLNGTLNRRLKINEEVVDYRKIRYVIDDKIVLDGVEEKGEIVFYNYDIQTQKKEECFRYSYLPPDDDKWKFETALLHVNHNNIFVCETYNDGGISYRKNLYMIPAKRKEMLKVSEGYIEKYALSEKFLFYIDREHRIHKYNIKDLKDVIISDIKAMDIAYTKKGLYVQKYDRDLADTESYLADNSSCEIYFMDFDGKNVVKIEDEKIEWE